MMISYPVIFSETENNYLIEVPDLGIFSEANSEHKRKCSVEEAIQMARDAIGLTVVEIEDNGLTVPPCSDINSLSGTFTDNRKAFVSIVDLDIDEYRWQLDNRMERCNVTLQHKLKKAAEKAHLNLSALLQQAVRTELNIK